MTLQYLFTAMAGLLLGRRWGALSQAVYVLLGLVGLPIFTMGGGFGYVFQPTFGFLLGLIPGRMGGGCRGKSGDLNPTTGGGRGGRGGALRGGKALLGLYTPTSKGRGYDVFRAAVGGDAALPAGRRSEDHRGGGRVPRFAAAVKIGGWQR